MIRDQFSRNLIPLLRRLGVPEQTFYPWLRGDARPPWKRVRQLADSHKRLSLADLVQTFWKENVGDPCPCGCGGKKIVPEKFPKIRGLVIETPCEKCGSIRTWRRSDRHYKLCGPCAVSSDRVERIEFTCVGFKYHGARRHAKNCPRKK
jgi:hypothetical protein